MPRNEPTLESLTFAVTSNRWVIGGLAAAGAWFISSITGQLNEVARTVEQINLNVVEVQKDTGAIRSDVRRIDRVGTEALSGHLRTPVDDAHRPPRGS